jgi:putative peptidoglycan lipid II flippase
VNRVPGLGRAAVVVSVGILLSRVLGFLRDVAMAGLLGRTELADLYQQAFIIPDDLLFLLAGGYLSITLVPILAGYEADGDEDEGRRAFTAVFRVVGAGLVALTAVTILGAGWIVETVFPEVPDPDRLIGLTRIALASQVFFGLGALFMAAQYARRRFLIPTLAPIVYNAGIILGGLLGWWAGDPSPESFLWGGLAGAVLGNFTLQWWGARREGVAFEVGVPMRHPAVGSYLRLALPLMIGQSVVALDEQWHRLFGQFVDTGATAGLGFARRLNMLPVGVIAQAAGVAAFPFLARLAAEGDRQGLRATVSSSVRTALAVGGLAAAAMFAVAEPVVRLAYQREGFGPADTAFVAPLLAVYSISIPFWAVHQVVTRAFYAERRMWVPVAIGTGLTAAAIPAFLWTSTAYGAAGIAWTSTASVAAYTVLIAFAWTRHAGGLGATPTVAKTAIAAIVAGLAGRGVTDLGTATVAGSIGSLIIGGITVLAAMLVMGRLLGLQELETPLRRALRR